MARTIVYGHEHRPEQAGMQHGFVNVTPVADTPTKAHVTFPQAYAETPTVVVSGVSAVIGSTLKGVSVQNISTTGFDVYVNRTNATETAVMWIAAGKLA